MPEYYITVRKIVPLTTEEKEAIQKNRERGGSGYRDDYNKPFRDFQYGLLPINPDESRVAPILDVILTGEEYDTIKKAVIEVKK